MIRFLLNDQLVTIQDTSASVTLLNYLREHHTMTGTKEGCASGDCGACTVVVAELPLDWQMHQPQTLHYRAINSCVTLLSALHGKQLITVEHLSSGFNEDTLHPVQQAMVEQHASQCGFCTPGFVMSMFALFHSKHPVTRNEVVHALSGNLCRCTGYRPIIDAALSSCNGVARDHFSETERNTIEQLCLIAKENNVSQLGTAQLLMPQNRQQMREALNANPKARLVAGSTDLALEITQQLQHFDTLISVAGMSNLRLVQQTETQLEIGAASPISDFSASVLKLYPALAEIIERFASLPIRNQATLGGNIANASPIGDMPPVLLALGASLVLDNGIEQRQIPLHTFFTAYKQTTLGNNEWIDRIVIPLPRPNSHVRAYKVSKRYEDDISAVCVVFNVCLEDGIVKELNTGFGGVAATPKQCESLESAVIGKEWHLADTMHLGQAILLEAFTPLDDVRASAKYRSQMLANLWHRFWLETNTREFAIPTRVTLGETELSHA